ncbi:hypothetical protein EC991_003816 [Linnemannia zychae]|nr:hypothetical protein EC991_003816 [Linnemannia zychae]
MTIEEDADEVFLLPPTHRLKHEMSCDDLYMYMAWDSIAAADEVQMSVDISHPMPAHDEARQQELLALRKAALTTMLNIVDGTKTTYRSYLFIFKREVPQDTPLLSEQTASIGRSKKKRRTVPTVDLAALLRDVIDDKDGRKALEVPCGKTTMEQALKAIIKLHDLQRQRLTNPSDIKFQATDYLRSMIDQYHQGLVTGSYLDSSGALLNSIFALAYDTKQHIQLLLDAWENIEETTLSLTMRNHFGLAIRHSMMLRDEDLRNALLGNALMPIIPNKAGGTQVVHALTFTMNQDKMNKDVQRGDSTNKYPLQPILHQVSHDMVKKAYLRQGINLNNIAHAGRHSGALEAQKMGLSAHHIQIAGRSPTVSGRMDQGYPVDAAFALAGFMNHPFHLRRCEVHPSNELQMTIFSFVESALFSEGSVERREWVRKCRDAMEEKLSETKQPYHTVHIEPLRDMVAATRDEDSTNQFTRQQLFLLMLVRMRRIILQDAAEYLCRFEGMNQPVLLKPVFRSPAFKAFQEEVRLCLSQPEPVEIHQWPPEAIQAFKHNEEIFYSLNNEVQQCRAELSSFLQEHRDFKRELGQWQQAMEQKLDQRLRQDRLAMQQIMEHWFKQNQRDTERIYTIAAA